LLVLTCFLGTEPVRAEPTLDPLRLVPEQAEILVHAPRPTAIADAITQFPWFRQLQELQAIQELYDSTNVRRFQQLVAHFEKKLGVRWPEALDKLAGGGAVLASRFTGGQPAPVLLVVQGRDAALTAKFWTLSLELMEAELKRQEAKEAIEKKKHREVEYVQIGSGFFACVVDAAFLQSNNEKALQLAIDLHCDGDRRSIRHETTLQEARKLLPRDPLAMVWVSLKPAHASPNAKEVFAVPNKQPQLIVFFGHLLDLAKRSQFVATGLYREEEGFRLTMRLPAGRDGMADHLGAFFPPPGEVATLPLLEPKGVLYSTSYYFNLGKFWELRNKILDEQQLKQLEEFEKNSGRFLLGNRLGVLVEQAGGLQRFVVANQQSPVYKTKPNQPIPAFALVLAPEEPEPFAKAADGLLRASALLALTQVRLKLEEVKHGDVKIVSYRFPETEKLRGDGENFRFNFSPSFAAVGDQFLVASTFDLCRELCDAIAKEGSRPRGPAATAARLNRELAACEREITAAINKLAVTKDPDERGKMIATLTKFEDERKALAARLKELGAAKLDPVPEAPRVESSRFYMTGLTEALRLGEDQLIAQTILNQALSPEEARKQVQVFLDLLRQLGNVGTETALDARQFRVDLFLQAPAKK
jgi:hypothetical protein